MYAVQTYIMHQQLRGIYIYCVTEMRLLVLHETSRHLLTKDGWYESRGVFIIEKLQMLTIDCILQLHLFIMPQNVTKLAFANLKSLYSSFLCSVTMHIMKSNIKK